VGAVRPQQTGSAVRQHQGVHKLAVVGADTAEKGSDCMKDGSCFVIGGASVGLVGSGGGGHDACATEERTMVCLTSSKY